MHFRKHDVKEFYRAFVGRISGYTLKNMFFRKTDRKFELTTSENGKELVKCFERLLNCEEPAEKCRRERPEKRDPEEQ